MDAKMLEHLGNANEVCAYYKDLLNQREREVPWDILFADTVNRLVDFGKDEDETKYNSAVRQLVIMLEDYEDDERLVVGRWRRRIALDFELKSIVHSVPVR